MLLFLSLFSWLHLDPLPPVRYTEGILPILHKQSLALYIAGILSLLWIPVSFLIKGMQMNSFPTAKEEHQKPYRRAYLGIALYYLCVILSPFFGNFPVPFMGYGASPILGFFLMMLADQEEERQG